MIVPLQAEYIMDCAQIMVSNPLWQAYHVTENQAQLQFRQGLVSDDAQIRVALDNQMVTGFIWYYLRGTFLRGAYIRLVGVHRDHQGKGIGAQLMQTAEAEVVLHTQHIFLLSSDFNTDAHRFYDRLGYRSVGELPDFAQVGISEMIFYKTLQ